MRSLLAAALLASLLAGCVGGPTDGPVVPPRDEEGRYVIQMTSGNRFEPGHALVPRGATVVWVNEGGTHDVTAANGSWSSDDESGKLRDGETFERTFGAIGSHAYVCKVHRALGMEGIVEVQDTIRDPAAT